MEYNEEKIDAFLEGKDTEFDDEAIDAFLDSDETTASPPDVQEAAKQASRSSRGGVVGDTTAHDAWVGLNQWAAGANDVFLNTLGLPGDAYNWVAGKLGVEGRVYGSQHLRELGEEIGIGYSKGKEPDLPQYKAGQYTGYGLEFLAPFLRLGKGTYEAGKMGQYTLSEGGKVYSGVQPTSGITKGIAETIAKPFVFSKSGGTVPLVYEIGLSTVSGGGAYYGEKEWGQAGEIAGGLLAPLPFMLTPALAPVLIDKGKKMFFPYTKPGARAKASARLADLQESKDVLQKLKSGEGKILKGAHVPPAQVIGDKHLIALQQKVIKENPELAHLFELQAKATNKLAREEMEKLGKTGSIADTNAWFKARTKHTVDLINRRIDDALELAKDKVAGLHSGKDRSVAYKVVQDELDKAYDDARLIENEAWGEVDRTIGLLTTNVRSKWEAMVNPAKRSRFANVKDIPKVARDAFGYYDSKGLWIDGTLSKRSSVGELQDLRSTLGQLRRAEQSLKGAANNNKVRILSDMEDALFRDMAKAKGGRKYKHALEISRKNNATFRGDILDNIYGHARSGGRLSPESALESVRDGANAVKAVKKILEASPTSHGILEEVMKLNLTRGHIINTKGAVNVGIAERYMKNNKELLDLFPDLRTSLQRAIDVEKAAQRTNVTGKARIKAVDASRAAHTAKSKPLAIIKDVMSSANPAKEMRLVLNGVKGNSAAQAGLKRDVVEYLLNRAGKASFDEHGVQAIDGKHLMNIWKNEGKTLRKVFNGDEIKRVETIINTFLRNELPDHLPSLSRIVDPAHPAMNTLAAFVGAQLGGRVAKHTAGGSIQTAGKFSGAAQKLVDWLDTTKATQILMDSINDPKLFKALYLDMSKPKNQVIANQIITGWMAANVINDVAENYDRFYIDELSPEDEALVEQEKLRMKH